MAKIRKVQSQQKDIIAESLAERDDAYTQGAFKYLRILVHSTGVAQFIYAAYYLWFYVHTPITNEDELRAQWGGKLKFMTFIGVVVQALYHLIAFLNDLFGSNAVDPQPPPALRRLRDYIFAIWAFPIALNVALSFWAIYAIDRELIFPASLDVIFPNWLNHVVHTNVAMMCILDIFTCFRFYPTRSVGIRGNLAFVILYCIWMHVVRYFSGHWVYPILDIMNMPLRYLLLSGLVCFSVICYIIGEFINNVVWGHELKLVNSKTKAKIN